MKYLVLSILFATALLYPTRAIADDADLHFAAHAGASYALSMLAYGFYHQAFRMDKTSAFVFAAVTTLAIGLTYKEMEVINGGTSQSIPRAMTQNTIGVLGAGFSIVMFQF